MKQETVNNMSIGEEPFAQALPGRELKKLDRVVKEYIDELRKVGVVKDPNKLTDEEKLIIKEGCDHIIKTHKKCCEAVTSQEIINSANKCDEFKKTGERA